jgi:hypothetical protein
MGMDGKHRYRIDPNKLKEIANELRNLQNRSLCWQINSHEGHEGISQLRDEGGPHPEVMISA